jgi:hypothetical protein
VPVNLAEGYQDRTREHKIGRTRQVKDIPGARGSATLADPEAADERLVDLAPVVFCDDSGRETRNGGSKKPWRRLVYAMQRAPGRRVPEVRLSYRFG